VKILEKHIDMKNKKKEKYKEFCREKDWRFFWSSRLL